VTASGAIERLTGRPDRFPGAVMLCGPSEARLESEARRLAAILLCPGDDPERRCASCRRVASGLHPDLSWVEPEGVQIRVNRVREALAFGAGRPYESTRRVAVVARAEMLGLEAGNALLKSLEEPGAHFHWILATKRPEALAATIRSRCVAAVLDAASVEERRFAWRSRGFSEEDTEDLAALDPERPEEAGQLLEQYRKVRADILAALDAGFSRGELAALLLLAETLARQDERLSRLLGELLADAAMATSVSPDLLRHRALAGPIRDLARRLPPEALRRAALAAADAPRDSRSGNKRLHFEALLLQMYLARD
jgi:DNA polymerase-3 subunit delta'